MSSVSHSRKRELIKIKLSQILQTSTGNPKFAGVTIVDVKLSPDSTSALVFFSVYTSSHDTPEIQAALNKAHGFFQSKLANTLKTRNLPKLQFVFDKGFDHAQKIDRLLHEIE